MKKSGAVFVLALTLSGCSGMCGKNSTSLSHFGDMLQEHYVRQFRANTEIRRKKLAALKTPEDAKRFVAEAKARIRHVANFPREKCPLNPRITGFVENDGMVVKNVLFDSRPGFPVSASLYIPKGKNALLPGILFLCGHADREGRTDPDYQPAMIALCRKGAIVLSVDAIGQGERRQYPGETGLGSCAEHNRLNKKLLAVGDWFGSWRLYDAVRSLDYLLTVPGVDPKRIGVTGNSGGGTMTTLLNGIDDRIAASAPSCYVTTWLHCNVEDEVAADGEQIPPGVAVNGGELADFFASQAPRPLLILGKSNDFSDIRGTKEVYEELKKLYTLLGKPENVQLFIGPGNHGFSLPNREAVYGFFNSYFKLNSNAEEGTLKRFPMASLLAAPGGSVLNVPGAAQFDMLFAEIIRQKESVRPRYTKEQLKTKLKKILGIGKVEVPYYRLLRPCFIAEPPRAVCRYAVETEPGILCTLSLFSEGRVTFNFPTSGEAELFIPEQSTLNELSSKPIPEKTLLFGFDYRGGGESMPNGCNQQLKRSIFESYGFDYHYSSLALLQGKSMMGARVYDTLSAIRLLRANGIRKITLTGHGYGQLIALFAAFLSEEPVELKLKEKLRTYKEELLLSAPAIPQSMIPFGILEITDIDEILKLK